MREQILFGHNRPLSGSIPAWKKKIEKEIEGFKREYILKVSESDLCDALVKKYELNPPKLGELYIFKHGDLYKSVHNGPFQVPVTGGYIEVAIPFKGDSDLFLFRGSSGIFQTLKGELAGNELRHEIDITGMKSDDIKRICEKYKSDVEVHLQSVRDVALSFNQELPNFISGCISKRKQKILGDLHTIEATGIPIRRRSNLEQTFNVPEIKRKPVIVYPKVRTEQYSPEPVLPTEEFDYILGIIEKTSHVFERSPKAFQDMGEEDLRCHLLVQLNGHYEGMATGETFNSEGKSDILIRYNDKNVFISECKFWGGKKKYLETINQLFKYTCWRDTKVAIIIFNRNKDLSRVLQAITDETPKHHLFKKLIERRDETHFRFLFHQPEDENRDVFLAVLVFCVPS